MTSIAFIMGVVPLVFSSGAGAEVRSAMGVAVFSGMVGVTVFGLFLTPVFYTVVGRLARQRVSIGSATPATAAAGIGGH
jgi:multidrug efflux pump subunit AcrB